MNPNLPPNQNEIRNLMLAVMSSIGLLYFWQKYYVEPQKQAFQAEIQAKQESDLALKTQMQKQMEAPGIQPRSQDVSQAGRVRIHSPALHGSIHMQGLRFDDLTLARHRTSVDENSDEIVLLSPANTNERYFMQIGWLAAQGEKKVTLPDTHTIWTADQKELKPGAPVEFRWTSPEGVVFTVTVALDENYLFSVTQRVSNATGQSLSLMPYGLINRVLPLSTNPFSAIVHEGPVAMMDRQLTETGYVELEKEGSQKFSGEMNWLGMADKYWLTGFLPHEQGEKMTVTFHHLEQDDAAKRIQVDYLAQAKTIPAGEAGEYRMHLFAGAKEINVLQRYQEALHIPLFDRAIDFGVLYFLTKPIFLTLDYFYALLGNFGLAILLFVVVLKVILFPLSQKSYKAMAKMRVFQPEIERLKKECGDDKLKLQQEMMQLWKRERINPMSGCLPMLVQLPIFFALYKVLVVTIEMRHAPFYGWVVDLSAKDPTNVFTLFGLLEWNPPGLLHIGLWPVIMAVTMILQQKMNPKPTDPVQAKVIGMLPYIFLFLFASFPAGLLVYWAWNNVLSILQQWVINRNLEKDPRLAKRASKQAS